MTWQVAAPRFLHLPEVLSLVGVVVPSSTAGSLQWTSRSMFRLVITRSSGLRRRSTTGCQLELRRDGPGTGYVVRGRRFNRSAFLCLIESS